MDHCGLSRLGKEWPILSGLEPEKLMPYRIPTDSKGKITTGKDELKRLAEETGDPVLSAVIEYRSLGTVINNYLPNWEPGPDGRVHPVFHYSPPTGQIASRRPNVQNASKHNPRGQRFRLHGVKAPQGHTFVSFDYQRFHVATMGYCANDPKYIRFAIQDSHTIFTSFLVGKPVNFRWSDGDIKAYCKELRKGSHVIDGIELPISTIRQAISKPAVLGNQLGLGPRKLHYQNREYIRTETQAKQYQAILAAEFPKPARFKDQVRERAHLQTYLMNDFGRIQHFYEVFRFKWNDRANAWERNSGNDSEKCIAFAVQSPAHDMIQGKLFVIGMDRCKEWGFINCVHDSLEFMPRDEDVADCVNTVGPIMVEHCKELTCPACPDGLSVGVDVSMGKNWGSWHEEKNPEGMKEVHSFNSLWVEPQGVGEIGALLQ